MAGVLRNPQLARAIKWRKSERPTAAWAKRYDAYDDDFRIGLRCRISTAVHRLSNMAYWLFALGVSGILTMFFEVWIKGSISRNGACSLPFFPASA